MATRNELVAAAAERYARSSRSERGRILDEFVAVTGHHRKHAMRLQRGADGRAERGGRRGAGGALGGVRPCLRQAASAALAGAGRGHGTARPSPARAGGADRGAGDERGDGRPSAAGCPNAGWREAAASDAALGCGAPECAGADLLRLAGPGAGLLRGRPGSAQRADGAGQLRADAGADRHRHGLDGVRAAAGPRAGAGDRGPGRGAPGPALRAERGRHGQRHRLHERDGPRLLHRRWRGVHALQAVPQERPGPCRAEERCRGAADRGLSTARGPGGRSGTGGAVPTGAAVREFLPALVQAGGEVARRCRGAEAVLRTGNALPAVARGHAGVGRGPCTSAIHGLGSGSGTTAARHPCGAAAPGRDCRPDRRRRACGADTADPGGVPARAADGLAWGRGPPDSAAEAQGEEGTSAARSVRQGDGAVAREVLCCKSWYSICRTVSDRSGRVALASLPRPRSAALKPGACGAPLRGCGA